MSRARKAKPVEAWATIWPDGAREIWTYGFNALAVKERSPEVEIVHLVPAGPAKLDPRDDGGICGKGCGVSLMAWWKYCPGCGSLAKTHRIAAHSKKGAKR